MDDSILVINPNSSVHVTEGISAALDSLRMRDGPAIECTTLACGPPAIETRAHVQSVIGPMCNLIGESPAGAFVIACYSDPGLAEARRTGARPVFGMAESGMLMALGRGAKFGVISILAEAVERHLAYVDALGLTSRLAADLPVGLGVLELENEAVAWDRLVNVGKTLRDRHEADVVLLGCAGMAPYRARLEAELGIPVIDPTQAAVTMAIGTIRSA